MNMGTSVCNKTPQNYKKGEEEQNRKGSGTLVIKSCHCGITYGG